MINTSYRYPWYPLWQGEGYPPEGNGCLKLVEAIVRTLEKTDYIPAKPEAERRTDGQFLAHPCALLQQDTVDWLDEKGLHLEIWRQAIFTFIVIVPKEHLAKEGYADDMDTIMTFASCAYADTNFAMYCLRHHSDVIESAAKGRRAVIMITTDKPRTVKPYVGIWSRITACFHLNYDRFYLDVTPLIRQGITIGSIEGYEYPKGDPDAVITDLDGIRGLDVSGTWMRCTTPSDGIADVGNADPDFDLNSFIHSETGLKTIEGSALNAMFKDAADPRMIEYFDQMGVVCEFHEVKGETWVSFVPKDALKEGAPSLPVMGIFGETGMFNAPGVLSIFGTFYTYIQLAAQGQLIASFFAQETADGNDVMMDVLKETVRLYHADPTRLYVTGHSHNGRYTLEFARRFGKRLAGIAPLSIPPGIEGNITAEQEAQEASRDLPQIFIVGTNEIYNWIPLHTEASARSVEANHGDLGDATVEARVKTWQRRLSSAHCPMKSYEEIVATKNSSDIVERKLGIPADRTDVLFLDGYEQYIADIRNLEGKYHLRVIGQENCPHCAQPSKYTLSWSFLRRFARNLETGEVVELY